MPNIPDDLVPPAAAVGVSRVLKVKTSGWVGPQSQRRDPNEYEVLAIGWSGGGLTAVEFAYLVFDPIHHEVMWVGQSVTEGVYSSLS